MKKNTIWPMTLNTNGNILAQDSEIPWEGDKDPAKVPFIAPAKVGRPTVTLYGVLAPVCMPVIQALFSSYVNANIRLIL